VDGHLQGRYGESHKVSALETLQFSTISIIHDVNKCVTMDSKCPDDLIYILGTTGNELGASEYYEHFGYVGLNVPQVSAEGFKALYKALTRAIDDEIIASAHGIYRGGLGVHLAMVAMGGGLGMNVDLADLPVTEVDRNDVALFSESAGRFIVTIAPENQPAFEKMFAAMPFACIGKVTDSPDVQVKGLEGKPILSVPVGDLKSVWQKPFGALI
jgi:phosphoribosylformylglycinamidine synthase